MSSSDVVYRLQLNLLFIIISDNDYVNEFGMEILILICFNG